MTFENEQARRLMGGRVRAARESCDLTQDQLADRLDINDRQTLSDIENGKRSLKADELVKIAQETGRDIEFFLDPFNVVGEAEFCWRASPTVPQDNLESFEIRAGQWVGLLRWLRTQEEKRHRALKYSLRVNERNSYEQARAAAEQLAWELDLGTIPANRLFEKIETELDVPVLFFDPQRDEDISGATCHLYDLAVILVNRLDSDGRRNYNLAHELFHALTWDAMTPAHRESNLLATHGRSRPKRIEQLADNFAAALLMPTVSIKSIFDASRAGDLEHLRQVAAMFRVSPEALGWRLFNLELIAEHTCTALSRLKQLIGDNVVPSRFSKTFVQLLHSALDTGKLSARKATKVLGMKFSEMIELFAEYKLSAPTV